MRRELINEYISLYNSPREGVKSTKTYTRLSELWMNFSDEERAAINRRFLIDTMW